MYRSGIPFGFALFVVSVIPAATIAQPSSAPRSTSSSPPSPFNPSSSRGSGLDPFGRMNRLDVTPGRPFGVPWSRPGDLSGMPAAERERLQKLLDGQRKIMQALLNAMRQSINLDKADPAMRKRLEDMQAQLDAWKPKELSEQQKEELAARLHKLTGGREPKPSAESDVKTIPEDAGPIPKPLLPAGSLPLHEKHPLFSGLSGRPEPFKLPRPLLLAARSPSVEEVRDMIRQSALEQRPLVLALAHPEPVSLEDAKWAHLRGAATIVVVEPNSYDTIEKLCRLAEESVSGLEFEFFPPEPFALGPTGLSGSRRHGELTVANAPESRGLDGILDPLVQPIQPPSGIEGPAPDEWETLPSSEPEVAPFEPIPGYADPTTRTAPCEKVRKEWDRLIKQQQLLRARKAQMQQWIDSIDRIVEQLNGLIERRRGQHREASRYDPEVEAAIHERRKQEYPARRAKLDAARAPATAAWEASEAAFEDYERAMDDYRNASRNEREAKQRIMEDRHRIFKEKDAEWERLQAVANAAWDEYRNWDRSFHDERERKQRMIESEIERLEATRAEYLAQREELRSTIRDEIDSTPDTPDSLAWIERELGRLERKCDEKYSAARTAWREARDRFEGLLDQLTAAEERSQEFRRSQRFGDIVASRGPDSDQTAAAAAAATQAMDQARNQLNAARQALTAAGRALSQLDQRLEDGEAPTAADLGAVHQQLATAADELQDGSNAQQQGEDAFHRLVATSEAHRRAQRQAEQAASAATTPPGQVAAQSENPCFRKLLTADKSALLFSDPKNRNNYIRIEGKTVTVHAGGRTWTAAMHSDVEQWFRDVQPGQIKAGLHEEATRTANGQESTRSGDVMVAGPDRQNRTARPGYMIEIALRATDESETREFFVSISVDADDCGSWTAQVLLFDQLWEFATAPPGSVAQMLFFAGELKRRRTAGARLFFDDALRLFLSLNAWDSWIREQGGTHPRDLRKAVQGWKNAVDEELSGWFAGQDSPRLREAYQTLKGLLRDGFPDHPVENMEYTREVLQVLFTIRTILHEQASQSTWGTSAQTARQ